MIWEYIGLPDSLSIQIDTLLQDCSESSALAMH